MIKACFHDRYKILLDFLYNSAKEITLYGCIFEYTEVSEKFYIYQGMNKCGSCGDLDYPVKVRKSELTDNI